MIERLRVLSIEDSATDAKLVRRELERDGGTVDFLRVDTEIAMRAALESQSWDLILSDWAMPKFSAAAALAILREKNLDLPFIIVSGSIDEEAAVQAMRAGAHDYVLKDKLGRLAPAIERELRECKSRAAHRRAEAALHLSNARFSRLTMSGIIGVITGDSSGTILEANDAFLQMIGYTRAELEEGKVRWRDLTPAEWMDATNHALEQLRDDGVAVPYEKAYTAKDGTLVPVLIGIATLSETTSIAFMVDLTAQKKVEEALRKTEAQLRHSQKMEAVGRLAAGIAHDFNNLLSVILSYSSMAIAELPEGEPLRDDLREIEHAGERAADLTRQLVMFSRQDVVEPRILSVNDVLTKMNRMLQRVLGEDIDLVCLKEARLEPVQMDPGQLEQILMNLVVNARDAMPQGGKLTIETTNVVIDATHARTHPGVEPGAYVLLAVSDTGCGMDQTTQSRIFEPFFTTKEKGKGTGLGLATVFGIAEQCGGSISVCSAPGRGARFTVLLPQSDVPKELTAAASAPVDLRGDETILLVEDDDQLRAVAREILRKQGYAVFDVANGIEALRLWDNGALKVDLLLTDVVMPQMSGTVLATRMTRTHPALRVLCMSGYTDDAIFRHGSVAPGIAYLQKPITPEKLIRKVRQVLDRA